MRNKDLEQTAYQRFRRQQRNEKDKHEQSDVKDLLVLQSSIALYVYKYFKAVKISR